MCRYSFGGVFHLFLVMGICVSVSSCLHFLRNGSVTEEQVYTVPLKDLSEARFYKGMPAAENLYLDPDTLQMFVTTLEGRLYLLDGTDGAKLTPVAFLETEGYILGIDRGPNGALFAAMTDTRDADEWKSKGGYVARIVPDLSSFTRVTDLYPAINGLACTPRDGCYLASSNFSFIAPKGRRRSTIFAQTVEDGSG